jgi:hypothetical protein
MIRMLAATYAESVSCTPMWAIGDPSGPIENGTTYIVAQRLLHLGGVAPVVGRAGVGFLFGADERPVLDARDVTRVGASQVGVGPLGVGELLEGAGLDQLAAECLVLLRGAVAPVDRAGLGESRNLLDPGPQSLVLRGRFRALGGCRGRLVQLWINSLIGESIEGFCRIPAL